MDVKVAKSVALMGKLKGASATNKRGSKTKPLAK